MKLEQRKTVIVALWALALCVGAATGVTSVSGWAVLAGIVLIPSVIMMLLWRRPSQSMSESIQQSLR